MDLSFLAPFIQSFATKYPIILNIFVFVGIFRILMKPIMALIIKYVELNPDPAKRAKVEALLQSRGWQTVAFAIDYIFSVKLPYAPGSIGIRVQEAVQAEKGQSPTQP